jgi:hypothetical protein
MIGYNAKGIKGNTIKNTKMRNVSGSLFMDNVSWIAGNSISRIFIKKKV